MNPSTDIFLMIFLGGVLSTAAVIDWRIQKIPNWLTFPAMAIALTYHGFINGAEGFFFSGEGMFIGICVLIIPFLMGGMGAGDAKLMGVVGAILGPKAVFIAFLLTALIGGGYALIMILIHRRVFKGFFQKYITILWSFILTRQFIPEPAPDTKNRPRLCYGVAIALGTFSYVVLNVTGCSFIN